MKKVKPIIENSAICALEPLKQFYCDHCGLVISCPAYGTLRYERTRTGSLIERHHFGIYHTFCPINFSKMPKRILGNHRIGLESLIGPKGLLTLLGFLDSTNERGQFDSYNGEKSFTEALKRLQLPYYEQGRFLPGFDPSEASQNILEELLLEYNQKKLGTI